MKRNLFRDCSGVSTAEYALILAMVGAGIGAAVYRVGIEESAALIRTADAIIAGQSLGSSAGTASASDDAASAAATGSTAGSDGKGSGGKGKRSQRN